MTETRKISYLLPSLLLGTLLFVGCGGSSAPIDDLVPSGLFERVKRVQGGEIRSTLRLEPDSAFFFDTIYSDISGTLQIDSIHHLQMELNPSADGYFRAVEEERAGGGDVTGRSLRYWFFFQKRDSLFFYRGMRYRGDKISLPGTWSMSAADSAFLGSATSYTFTSDSVTVTTRPSGEVTRTSYTITVDGVKTILFGPGNIPPYGPRYEIIPGLALYLTTRAETGYVKVADLES